MVVDKNVKQVMSPPPHAVDTLKSESWRYAGCGYWIDPVTKSKHSTSTAFEIVSKRKASNENIHANGAT